MDNLTAALESKLAQQTAQSQLEREAEEALARIAEAQKLACLTRLRESDDVRWLFTDIVAPIIGAELDRALDITLTPEQRTAAAQRHDIASTIAGLIEAEWRAADQRLHSHLDPQ